VSFLIYFAVDSASSWFMFALFFTEVLPWGYFLYIIAKEKYKKKFHPSVNTNRYSFRGSSDISVHGNTTASWIII
jgi:hypothetical protein